MRERFEEKYTRGEDWKCWPWTAAKDYDGRGVFKVNTSLSSRASGGTQPAPRVAYELYVGPVPYGLVVMHTCDNPNCVNPAHLRIGTQTENMRDMINKGRAGWMRVAA